MQIKSHIISHSDKLPTTDVVMRVLISLSGLMFFISFRNIMFNPDNQWWFFLLNIAIVYIWIVFPLKRIFKWSTASFDTHHQIIRMEPNFGRVLEMTFDDLSRMKIWCQPPLNPEHNVIFKTKEIDKVLTYSDITKIDFIDHSGNIIRVSEARRFNPVITSYLKHVPFEVVVKGARN